MATNTIFQTPPLLQKSKELQHYSNFVTFKNCMKRKYYYKTKNYRPSNDVVIVCATPRNPLVKIEHKPSIPSPSIDETIGSTLSPIFPVPLMEASAKSLQYGSGMLGPIMRKTSVDAVVGDGRDGAHNAMNYLTKILTSKVYDVAMETPLDYAAKLSQRLGVRFWLKREDLQPVRQIFRSQ